MKIRTNYVSNSSSTSFVFAYNEDASLKVIGKDRKNFCLLTIEDFFTLIDNKHDWSVEKTEIVAKGMDNVKDYLTEKDEWGERHFYEGYAILLDKLAKCNMTNAAIIRLEYSDEISRKFLEAFKKTGQIILFEEQNE